VLRYKTKRFKSAQPLIKNKFGSKFSQIKIRIFGVLVSASGSNFKQKPHFALNFISQFKARAVFQATCSPLFRPHRTPF